MPSDRVCTSCGTSNPFIFKKCQKCQAVLGGAPPTVAAPPAVKVSLAPAGASSGPKEGPAPAGAGTAAPSGKIGLGGSAASAPAATRQSPFQATAGAPVPPPPAGTSASPPAFVAPVPTPGALPSVPPGPGASSWTRARTWLVGAAAAAAAVALIAWLFHAIPTVRDVNVTRCVVQVTTGDESGTGFFVDGPDEWAYVATAFHVVESGGPITIARAVEIAPDKHYIDAFPEAEIAAYDADSDLAVIRLRNVKRSAFGTLPLATRPLKGTRIKSYGFPGRTVMRRQGLLAQQGDVLSLGRIPVIDSRMNTIVRDSGVEGILISSALEPGYSGGPTCDEHGEVVGVNAIKDRTKMQHNAAIDVAALRRLLDRVKPLEKRMAPTAADVQALLRRISDQYLRLPPENRVSLREHEFIALSDLPKLRVFATEVRHLDRDGSPTPGEGALSGRAMLGLAIPALTGATLSTYHHEAVQQALATCEKRVTVSGFFDQLAGGMKVGDKDDSVGKARLSECDNLAVRPLTWDLAAITLRWDAERADHDFDVTKVDPADDDEPVYRASAALKTASTTFDVWVRWDGSDLKLKLLDKDGATYGLTGTRTTGAGALNGKWVRSRARTPHHEDASIALQWEETLEVSSNGAGQVTARHVVDVRAFAPSGQLGCAGEQFAGEMEASFSGTLKPGGAFLPKRDELKVAAASFEGCKVHLGDLYPPSAAMVLKTRGDRLVVYRTTGSEVPEEVEFTRR